MDESIWKNAGDADRVGLQYCPESVMNELHKNYPALKMMHTEGRCENGKNSMSQARKRFGEIASWINSGCENYCSWNIALNEKSASTWGWKQNSLIKIDRNTKVVTYNPDFAPLCLLSKYIRPGYKSLKVDMKEGTSIAVSNDDHLVVFLQNNEKTVKSQSIKIEGRVYSVEIHAKSLSAVVFKR